MSTFEGNIFDKISIEIENNQYIQIQIDDKIFYDNIKNLNITPNKKIYIDKLEQIIKYCRDEYKFVEYKDKYIFKFNIEIFDETLEIKINKDDFLNHKQAMKKLYNIINVKKNNEENDSLNLEKYIYKVNYEYSDTDNQNEYSDTDNQNEYSDTDYSKYY